MPLASPPPAILPAAPTFAGHATFALRSGWLKKGFDALEGARGNPIFNRPEAIATLGVGKNMVGSIRHWMLATRVAAEAGKGREIVPTELGRRLLADDGWDPFIEDEATLWLLHWQLAGPKTHAFTWAYTFSNVRDWEFGRDSLAEMVLAATHSLAKAPARDTVERDVACLLQSYVKPEKSTMSDDALDCPLRALGLIRAERRGHFRFSIESKPGLPPEVFAFALAHFWMWKRPEARTLPVWEVAHAEGSPGVVFKLDEDSVLAYLDTLAEVSEGAARFEDTALTRQVVLSDGASLRPLDFLNRFYARDAAFAR